MGFYKGGREAVYCLPILNYCKHGPMFLMRAGPDSPEEHYRDASGVSD